MHELIQSEIQSDIISEKKFVTSGGSVPFPFREIYPTYTLRYRKARNFRGLLIFVVAGKSTKFKYLRPTLDKARTHLYVILSC